MDVDLDADTLAMGGQTASAGPPSIHEDDDLLGLLLGSDGGAGIAAAASSAPPLPPPAEAPLEAAAVAAASIPKPAFARAETQAFNFDLDDDGASPSKASPGSSSAAAAASDGPAFASAVLVSTNAATAADIPLDVENICVGRDEGCKVTLSDLRVSAEQFIVRRKPAAIDSSCWEYELEDRSKNGTLVNKSLVKGSFVKLRERDLIVVLPGSQVGRLDAISFLFQGVAPASAASSASTDGIVTAAEEPPAKKRKTECSSATDAIFEFAMCVICQEVIHKATSVQPCNHSFCSSCLGIWLKKRSGAATCPMCRKVVTSVARQHQLDGIIQGLLKAHPSKGRSEAELKELDDQDPMKAAAYDLARLRGAGGGGGGGLFGAGGFAAAAMAAAAAAAEDGDDSDHSGSGSGSEAEGSDSPGPPPGPPCFHCHTPSQRTLGASAATVGAGFGGPRASSELVKQSLAGNDFERGVLEEWLANQSRGLGEALSRLLVSPNPTGAPPVRVRLPGGAAGLPGGTTPMPDGAWTDLNACRGCATGVLRALVYALRERIPDGELPPRARGRGNCWYGRGCRTQVHNPGHASKLNHICEQTRFR